MKLLHILFFRIHFSKPLVSIIFCDWQKAVEFITMFQCNTILMPNIVFFLLFELMNDMNENKNPNLNMYRKHDIKNFRSSLSSLFSDLFLKEHLKVHDVFWLAKHNIIHVNFIFAFHCDI